MSGAVRGGLVCWRASRLERDGLLEGRGVKRRVEEFGVAVPPAELVDYRRWCASRGVAPFGVPDDPVSMRAAVAQWAVWEQLRREWAARPRRR